MEAAMYQLFVEDHFEGGKLSHREIGGVLHNPGAIAVCHAQQEHGLV